MPIDQPRRVLIADRSVPMQRWLAMAVTQAAGGPVDITFASHGAELLHHLAHDRPYDLVVAPVALPHAGGGQVLAMVRTAGLTTPFLLLDFIPDQRLRDLVARVGRATLVEDPLDIQAIARAARAAFQSARPYQRGGRPAVNSGAPSRAAPTRRARSSRHGGATI